MMSGITIQGMRLAVAFRQRWEDLICGKCSVRSVEPRDPTGLTSAVGSHCRLYASGACDGRRKAYNP